MMMPNIGHWSDCATNNEPASPAGPCDCGGCDKDAWRAYYRVTGEIPTRGTLNEFLSALRSGDAA